MSSEHLSIRSHNVASEIIEGEAIIVDVNTGTYFSANPSASLLWSRLLAGPCSLQDLTATLHGAWSDLEAERIHRDVEAFIATLDEHDLLERVDAQGGGAVSHAEEAQGGPYEAPQVEVHTDMRDFLLVDPIHDVTASGFPEPRDG